MRRMAHVHGPRPRLAHVSLIPIVLCLATALSASAVAAPAGPGWSIRSLAQPTNFSPVEGGNYVLIVTNVGSQPTPAGVPVTISDTLPTGTRAAGVHAEEVTTRAEFGCTKVPPLQCVGTEVPAGGTVVVNIGVALEAGVTVPGSLNTASVSGGGAPAVTTTETTPFSSEPAPFGIESFSLQAFEADGSPSAEAGGRPYTVAASLYFNSKELGSGAIRPADEVKDVIVDLPAGLVGDPQVTPRCPLYDLLQQTEGTACPPASRVGTVVFEAFPGRSFRASEGEFSETTAVYNMQPDPGFPAEFGFTYLGRAVYMYASTVRIGGQLRLRVTVPGIPNLQTIGTTLLFFGNPGAHFGEAGTLTPFFTSPVDCAAGPLTATVEADSWRSPANQHGNVYSFAESTTYPQLAGCNLLQFQPTLSMRPDTTQADEPSGYTFTVANPQNESPLMPGTPELKDATVTLPAGVSISPSAADGLRACPATGPEGINIGNGQTLGAGQPGAGEDMSDLVSGHEEATELGAGHLGPGHPGGNSPYDDGLYHTAPGHCPRASTIGSVEVETPLLPTPLEGHLYIAEPHCGGSQPPCEPADALNGNLFGAYLEVAGAGAIVKLAGHVSANPSTGQITASFRENPQVPFSTLRLRLYGGPRAALANPQTCGTARASGDLSAWSAPATLDSPVLSQFTVDWDGAGGGCSAQLPFAPSLIALTTNPDAGAFSPFTFQLSRGDRQQYISQLTATMPQGLLGMLANVPLCGEPDAQRGTCPEASRIGTVAAGAGPGSHPFWAQGKVYLTGGYHGSPFGLSAVVPADAGPFHLGDIVVRSAINADPHTAQITITSDPLPQIIDGVPLRVQTLNVTVDREKFIFNPTSCTAKQVAVTVGGAQGALAHLSNPFAAANCRALPFSPKFTVSTQGSTSKKNGASFDVKVLYKPGQANIGSVFVRLPKQLPARLTTIQQACLAATFETNPATCPVGSLIGIAKASTPVLPVPVEGPAYLVSHGGAAFPDVVVILQGDGVRIDLTGHINIAKGITTSTFANIPDAPITSFELKLPESLHSALTTNLPANAHGNLCGAKLIMPTTLTGQNGTQVKQSTKISVTGCPKPKRAKKARKVSV
jgi:hypothetical protein